MFSRLWGISADPRSRRALTIDVYLLNPCTTGIAYDGQSWRRDIWIPLKDARNSLPGPKVKAA